VKKEDWAKLTLVARQLADAPLFFDDNPQVSIDEIKDQVLRFKNNHQLGLIIIDEINYLTEAKTKIGNKLRLLSRDFQLPIVATVYLEIAKRIPKHPVLNDLDAMGDLKKETDSIIFSHRSRRIFCGLSRNTAEIIIAKNKNGPCLILEKYYLAESCSFGSDVRND
jgi:replicative DNA helicase